MHFVSKRSFILMPMMRNFGSVTAKVRQINAFLLYLSLVSCFLNQPYI